MSCPSDDALNRYLEGIAPAAELETIERHLDDCARCRDVALAVGTLVAERSELGGAPTEAMVRLAPAPESPPVQVGRFLVRGPLGEGSMGRTYAGYDPELDRAVCLKLLKPLAGAGDDRARVLAEARAQARLSHPAIVSVYEVVSEGSSVGLAMELLEGARTLRAWLGSEPRAWRTVVDVLRQAGEGLAAAHAGGVVHRDFKPENVLVTADGRARIVDFGLARRVVELELSTSEGPLEHAARAHTRTLAAGTPAYMAPEQFQGQPGDAASDQYAFCVTLYEALAGVRPFARASLGAQLRAQRAHQVPPLATAPPALMRALVRGLSPRPEDRFESMTALLEALDEVTRGKQATAPVRAARVALALGAAVLLGAGALLASRGPPGDATPTTTVDSAALESPTSSTTPAAAALAEPAHRSDEASATQTSTATARVDEPTTPATPRHTIAWDITPRVSIVHRGRVLGRSPGTYSLPAGAQVVELVDRARGIRQRLALEVGPGLTTVRRTLVQGELEVRVSPWAYVSLDGRPLGASPVPVQEVYEGEHELLLERPDLGQREVRRVRVAARERTIVRHVLRPSP